MKRVLTIEIDCGATTCASKPGKFCPWVETSNFGQRWHCGLFRRQELRDENGGQTGWLRRLPECLASENGAKEQAR